MSRAKMPQRDGLMPGEHKEGKISTMSLVTLMNSGIHKLKKPDGTNVSMPEDIDLLLALMPKLEELVPERYRVITRRPKFRKFVDDMELVIGEDGTPVIEDPPNGLTNVEAVLWRELGPLAPKAACWLYILLTTKKYSKAHAYTGLQFCHITLLKKSSSVFYNLYKMVDEEVKNGRKEENEEEIHRRAYEGVKEEVYGTVMEGENKVTGVVGEKTVYDNKLLVREQETLDKGFRNVGVGGSGGVIVNIQVNGLKQCIPEEVETASKLKVDDIDDVETEDLD